MLPGHNTIARFHQMHRQEKKEVYLMHTVSPFTENISLFFLATRKLRD